MGFKPDFTQDNPYEGVTEEYIELVEESFVPTPENPTNPVVAWYEENLDEPPPDPVVITITPGDASIYYPGVTPPKNVIIVYTPPSQPVFDPTEGVHKPTWLSDLLSNFNWDFMGVELYVGDAIEKALDWVMAWLNWLDYMADRAVSVAEDAFRTARDYVDSLSDSLNWRIQEALNVLDTWQSNLESWWLAQKSELLAAWDNFLLDFNTLRVRWDYFRAVTWPVWTGELAGLRASWSNFWSVTFPTLVSFSSLTGWWSSAMGDVVNLIDSAFVIREQFWAGWQDWRDRVIEFFTDPEDWLYRAVDRIVARYW